MPNAKVARGARRGAGNEPKRPRVPGQGETVVAKDPSKEPGKLKAIGGSMSDDWNNRLATDALNTVWFFENDRDTERKSTAAIAALIGIRPASELESMMSAQPLASHFAAMECAIFSFRTMMAKQGASVSDCRGL